MDQPFWQRWIEDTVAAGLAVGGYYLLTDLANWAPEPAAIFVVVLTLMTWQRPTRGGY